MITIDLWKVSGELSKLEKLALGGKEWVRLDDVIDILGRNMEEINERNNNNSPADSVHGSGVCNGSDNAFSHK